MNAVDVAISDGMARLLSNHEHDTSAQKVSERSACRRLSCCPRDLYNDSTPVPSHPPAFTLSSQTRRVVVLISADRDYAGTTLIKPLLVPF